MMPLQLRRRFPGRPANAAFAIARNFELTHLTRGAVPHDFLEFSGQEWYLMVWRLRRAASHDEIRTTVSRADRLARRLCDGLAACGVRPARSLARHLCRGQGRDLHR